MNGEGKREDCEVDMGLRGNMKPEVINWWNYTSTVAVFVVPVCSAIIWPKNGGVENDGLSWVSVISRTNDSSALVFTHTCDSGKEGNMKDASLSLPWTNCRLFLLLSFISLHRLHLSRSPMHLYWGILLVEITHTINETMAACELETVHSAWFLLGVDMKRVYI